ncbi:MAG: hypothetical protein P8M72_05760 [Gammaproteobacteria bacterium]|nr:hypothetical protein [Gammaproteobacteria bacterium]
MQSYLESYAEPETALLVKFSYNYQHVVCIPAFAENADFLNWLTKNVSTAYALVIVVVNAHTKADSHQIEQTRTLASNLRGSFQLKRLFADNILLLDGPGNMDILLVERCNAGNLISEAKGVGLARKIACDLACHLIYENKITNPWIHSTDADASLPADYFNGVNLLDPQTDSAGIYPFLHTISEDPGILQAQNLYDLSLRYYVDGLSWAGSDSAFHTVGSTLVVNSRHYAQVRGFPQKNAGEDFYLLSKLAKTGNIVSLDTSPISLRSRLSDRVPFGTGPALGKILALADPSSEFLYYHPTCFIYLKCWLALKSALWDNNIKSVSPENQSDIEKLISQNDEFSAIDSQVLIYCLQALGIEKALEHAVSHSTSGTIFAGHLNNWFDAFQTLKFIHWLRNNHFPSLPLSKVQTFTEVPFTASLLDYAPGQPASSQVQQ